MALRTAQNDIDYTVHTLHSYGDVVSFFSAINSMRRKALLCHSSRLNRYMRASYFASLSYYINSWISCTVVPSSSLCSLRLKVAVLQPFLKHASRRDHGAKLPRANSHADACSKLDEAVALVDTLGCEVVLKEVRASVCL